MAEGGGFFDRALDRIERVGNKLPDPVTLFFLFVAMVLLASWIAAAAGWAAVHPGTGEQLQVVNLLSREHVQRMLIEMPEIFTDFPPLGLVLVVMLGIGVAERTGLIATALKAFVQSVPSRLITASVVFAGIMSSLAVDAGYVVLIPLGAVIFHGVGRHPIAGLAAAFAGVSAGFSSNLLLTSLDPLLASFTEPAAHLIDPEYRVDATANYWLMIALVPFFVVAGTWVTERVLEPRLGTYEPSPEVEEELGSSEEAEEITPRERKGLVVAGLVTVVTLGLIALLVIPDGGVLRDPEGELLVQQISPFLQAIVALMVFAFFLPGLAYGLVVGEIKSDRDVAEMMSETMASMGAYIVLAFAAAHFVTFFAWSNLGAVLAITGADALQAVGFTGIPLIVGLVVVSSIVNLFVGSASAKWAVLGPIFVPMLMILGWSPELTQAAYRVGDSFSNIITPLLPYFPLVIIFAQRYVKDIGIGTLISAMVPYSVAFAVVSISLLILWMVLGIPLGPGAPMRYPG